MKWQSAIVKGFDLYINSTGSFGRKLCAEQQWIWLCNYLSADSIDIQDFLVIPMSADNFEDGFAMVVNVYNATKKIFAEKGKPIAAICAAPMVLGKLGLLKGKKATCYPGFEQYLEGAECVGEHVVRDGNIITGMGPGAAMEFALAIVELLAGKEKVDELAEAMCVKR